ncbi:serine/threonine-protein kinase haspin-like [Dermacentor albipictus]|uniref:serine/threonine-protein kinase haspin-like n=1 Tax=Dermacentor albipictus TaxID=60249 RepID=UPI0038FC81E1
MELTEAELLEGWTSAAPSTKQKGPSTPKVGAAEAAPTSPAPSSAGNSRRSQIPQGAPIDIWAALFQETQHYVLLEFEYGGKTLERSKATIEQLESVFLQVACSLAVAEPELEFEHRDLHCDNVLVKPTEQQFAEFVLHGRKVRVRTAGVKASVIDYTLSRTRIGGQVYFTDLSKDSVIFQGTGSVQYDIYRIMKEHNGDDWEDFRPHTNVLWLHYLLTKLFQKLPKDKAGRGGLGPSPSRGRLAAWMDAMLSFPSAEQFVVEQVLPHLERDAEAPRGAAAH